MQPEHPRFVADVMVGRLARWLRILGYDVLYDNSADDAELKRIAAAEGRVLLTRDREIAETKLPIRVHIVSHDDVASQLADIVEVFELDVESRLFTRCVLCNEPLIEAAREEVADAVPPYVLETVPTFARCPSCGKVYWPATHVGRARAWLAKALTRNGT
jgi:uncharacterized protein with PIN domain